MRVLLIEDDPNAAKTIAAVLTSQGWVCEIAQLGSEGVELTRVYNFDLIILDLMLPDVNGYEVLLRLRSFKIKIPVLILSAMSEVNNIVKGLSCGADDYLTKPFNKDELVARIQAIVRRSKGHSESVMRFDKVSINFDTRVVTVNDGVHDVPVHLTNKEYAILELLAMRKGSVLTKETFLSHLYSGLDEPEIKIIDVFVCKLRKKLADVAGGVNYIETVWGRGYILNENATDNYNSEHPSEINGYQEVIV